MSNAIPAQAADLYSADEVLQHFQALLDSLDFKTELTDLGCGAFSPLRRKKALRELRALTIALWGLALERSFPVHCADFFALFMASSPCVVEGSKGVRLRERAEHYHELLALKKESDFLPAAQYLMDIMEMTSEDRKSSELKTTLMIRGLYNLIFGKLI